MPSRVITRIVEQYAEDGAFLWLLRDRAVRAPHYRTRDLARLDERIEAHVDGLRVAGDEGWRLALEGLASHGEPGEAFVAAVLAFERSDPAWLDPLLAALDVTPELGRPIASALGWVDAPRLRGTVSRLLRDPSPFRRRLGVAALSVHRVDPGPMLVQILGDVPPVRARALRLVGELGRLDLRPSLSAALGDPDPDCRFWAAWSAVLLGERAEATTVLRGAVAPEGPGWLGFGLLLRALSQPEAMALLRDLPRSPQRERFLVAGAGILGDPGLVPWLLAQLESSALARLAGESIATITGLDLDAAGLVGEPPEDSGAVAADGVDWDADLPWPDAAKVRDWWLRNKLAPGAPLFLGQPVDPKAFEAALISGTQSQRRFAALELTLRRPGSVLPNCSARLRHGLFRPAKSALARSQ